MPMVAVSTPTPLSANCCIGTIEPSSAGDQRRTTTVLHASSELGGHHGWQSAIVDRGCTAASRWIAVRLHVAGALAQRHGRMGEILGARRPDGCRSGVAAD